jgi:hypothetical protein
LFSVDEPDEEDTDFDTTALDDLENNAWLIKTELPI